MKTKILALSLLASLSAIANQEVERTDKTSNAVVITVGQCSVVKSVDAITEQAYYIATLPVMSCQEYKTYRATVSGKSWNTTITPIAGTEKYSYKLEDATESNRQNVVIPADAEFGPALYELQAANSSRNQCESKRELLLRLAQAQKGQAKCTL